MKTKTKNTPNVATLERKARARIKAAREHGARVAETLAQVAISGLNSGLMAANIITPGAVVRPEEKRAVAATEAAIRRSGSNAQRFVNAGHKVVHRGGGEFRCVVCNVIASSDSDLTRLDERCVGRKGGKS
ncbi:MAG: hypothetical protein SFW67_28465 [Myxococcaceae bacterium]|nr:hypothetical protein [Myxococcaceae bacterium]